MTAIPDDIMRVARECADACLASSGLGDTDKYAAQIARAIMAERERATNVALKHMLHADEMFDKRVKRSRKGENNLELAAATACGMSHTARRIADEIRKGTNP